MNQQRHDGGIRGARALGLILVIAMAAPACGIGDRQQRADRIHASRGALADASPAIGTLTLELEPDERASALIGGEEQAQAAAALSGDEPAAQSLALQVALDAGDRRARSSVADPAVERATVFADTQLFVRRQNARATEKRTWARLDLKKVIDNERPLDAEEMSAPQVLAAVASTVNPVYLVELVEGALAGSVEIVGPENAGGVDTTRYDVNISFDKAMTGLDFDDDERAVRMRLFRLIGHHKDVVPASIWIDAEGRLRRLRLELEQRVSRQRTNHVIATIEFTELAADVAIDGPAPEAIVTYERFGRLVRSALPAEA